MTIQVSDKDFELLSQWVDGELNDVDTKRLEKRLAGEKALREALREITSLNDSLGRVFNSRATIPTRVTEVLNAASAPNDSNVVSFPGTARAVNPGSWRWPAAVAATLIAALGIALVNQSNVPGAQGMTANDAIVSASLDQLPSGTDWVAMEDGRQIQPVLTFEHQDGSWCREYLLRSGDSDWRAVACRGSERWITRAAGLESYQDAASDFRPAGAGDNAHVSVFISDNAADIALGADDELALIANDWQ